MVSSEVPGCLQIEAENLDQPGLEMIWALKHALKLL